MRFSIWPTPTQPWQETLRVAQHAEATGWDGAWYADHFMPNAPLESDESIGAIDECFSTLAGLAAAVPRLRLGSLVAGNTYRHPAVLAKIATTIDQISNGRFVLGIGAGWQENEHAAYGIEFFDAPERLRRLDEACQIIIGLTTNERTDLDGRYYKLHSAPLQPKPVNGKLPLLIGGGGEKVTLRIAATYADEWNVWGTPEVLKQKGAVLDQHCERIGRDPSTIKRSTQALLYISEDQQFLAKMRSGDAGRPLIIGTPEEVIDIVAAYQAAGVDELIVPDWNMRAWERKVESLDMVIERVAPAFRSAT
jgi:F420-dependent oxidoreductase-like protein